MTAPGILYQVPLSAKAARNLKGRSRALSRVRCKKRWQKSEGKHSEACGFVRKREAASFRGVGRGMWNMETAVYSGRDRRNGVNLVQGRQPGNRSTIFSARRQQALPRL